MCEQPVSPQQVWVAASELANACAQAPREAVQANKRVLNERVGESLMTQIAAGAADSATACTTDSAAEGIRAFLGHRDPQWLAMLYWIGDLWELSRPCRRIVWLTMMATCSPDTHLGVFRADLDQPSRTLRILDGRLAIASSPPSCVASSRKPIGLL